MRKFYILFFLSLILCITSVAQSASKLRKIGSEFEKNRVYEKASDYYLKALKKKSNEKEAIKGLSRCAPFYLKKLASEASVSFSKEKYQEVLDKYELMKEYQSDIRKYGVEVSVPNTMTNLKEKTDEHFAETFYLKGKENYNVALYSEAVDNFQNCLNFKSYYKDANNLLYKAKEAKNVQEAEKFYYSGVSKLNTKNFRSAYYDFEKCLSLKRDYKNASQLKKDALLNGRVKVGIFNVQNSSNSGNGLEKTLYSNLVRKLELKRSPFIEIVDFNTIRQQSRIQSSNYSSSYAAQIGRDIGLDYVLIGKILQINNSTSSPKSTDVTAYEQYFIKDSNGKSKPQGKKVVFKLYEKSSNVNFKVEYDLVSTKNNQIIKSNILSETISDNINYASYRGDYTKLCVTDPGSNGNSILGSLLTSVTMVDQKLFKARKQLKTPYELHESAFDKISKDIANEIFPKLN